MSVESIHPGHNLFSITQTGTAAQTLQSNAAKLRGLVTSHVKPINDKMVSSLNWPSAGGSGLLNFCILMLHTNPNVMRALD